MLTLLTLKPQFADTPDTGTFADGAIPYPMMEAQKTYRRPDGRGSFDRDYGSERRARQDMPGCA